MYMSWPLLEQIIFSIRVEVNIPWEAVTMSKPAQDCSLIQASFRVVFASKHRSHTKYRVAHAATTWAGIKKIEEAIPIRKAGDIKWGLRGGVGQEQC